VYQLCPELFTVGVLVAPRVQFPAVPVGSHAAGVKMEAVKVVKVMRSEKGKDVLVIKSFKFRFQKILAYEMERWFCTNEKVNAT